MSAAGRKQIFVIGNGPIGEDIADRVDAADLVVRFNEPAASGGMSGTKTDWLFVTNAGKSMQRRLNDDAHFQDAMVRAAGRVFLAYHPDIIARYHPQPNVLSRLKGRRADWTAGAVRRYGRAGKEVVILSPAFYDEGCDALEIPPASRRTVFPSTGYFGIRYVLGEFPADEWCINVCGFTWEGWKRHAWGDERRWAEGLAREGKIELWR